MSGAVLLMVDVPELMELGLSRLQALRVLADRDALSPRVSSPTASQPLSPPTQQQSSAPADSPWKMTHSQVMSWSEAYEWDSKGQKRRITEALREEEIKGSGL